MCTVLATSSTIFIVVRLQFEVCMGKHSSILNLYMQQLECNVKKVRQVVEALLATLKSWRSLCGRLLCVQPYIK